VKEKISQLHLTTVEDLKEAMRDCFSVFQPSTWKISRRTRGHTKICEKNGRENTDNFNFIIIVITGLLYQPQMIDEGDCGAIGEMKIARGNRSNRRKPVPPEIPHDLTRARTREASD
jgi:hypothetical protein